MAISCKDVSQSAVGIYIEVLQQTCPFKKERATIRIGKMPFISKL